MNIKKKVFIKAEVEVIRFEKTDVIATSGEPHGPKVNAPDPVQIEYGEW